MKLFKAAALSAMGFAAVLAGCSNSDGDSSSTKSTAPVSDNVQSFNVSECNDEIDAQSLNKLELAKDDMAEFYNQLANGDFKKAQAISSNAKATYASILEKYPAYCEAQLGYSIVTIADIINNDAISDLIDSLSGDNNKSLYKMSADEASNIVVKVSTMSTDQAQKSISDRLQESIAKSLLPAIDTSITYLTNVVNAGNMEVLYKYDGRTYELDNGEFAPALGALYLSRAILVAVVSINTDMSLNGSYSWTDSLEYINVENYKNNPAAKKVVELIKKDGPFGTVRSEWVKSYRNIPNFLDSAITYVQIGLQFGIDEGKKGLASQIHDPYVVGDDEDADVSIADMQKAIDALSEVKDAIKSDYTYDIDEKHSVTINISKFFNITNPKEYLPYYQAVKVEDWYKPVATDFWTDTLSKRAYVASALTNAVKNAIGSNNGHVSASAGYGFYDYNTSDYVDGNVISYDVEYKNGYAYGYLSVVTNGCEASFETVSYKYYEYGSDYVYNEETGDYEYVYDKENAPDTIKVSKTVKLSSDYCKVEGGKTMFLTSAGSIVPNIFNLTDKSGKVTITYRDLATGVKYPCDDHFHYRSYNIDELKELLVFPDVTFGGVLPGMTVEKFWDMLSADWEETGDRLDDAADAVEDFLDGDDHDRTAPALPEESISWSWDETYNESDYSTDPVNYVEDAYYEVYNEEEY